MEPWGTVAVAHSRPPWASTIERQIDSPIPMPLDLVVKKALKSRSAFSAEMPTPQSVTLTSTCCVSSSRDRITSSRGRSLTDCMASMPFITRLMIICCNWTRSPRIMGRAGAKSVRTDSPSSFLDDGPTSNLIRQILGAVSEFDKAMTVAKLKGARDRVRRSQGKCEGRKAYAEREGGRELVALARQLRGNPDGKLQ